MYYTKQNSRVTEMTVLQKKSKVLNQILINLVSRKFQADWSILIFLLQQLVNVQHRYIRVGLRQRHSHITN